MDCPSTASGWAMWLFVKQRAGAVFPGFLQCRRPAWLQASQRKRRGNAEGRGRYCRWWRGRRWLRPCKRRGKRRGRRPMSVAQFCTGFGVSRPRSTLMFACFIHCASYRNAQNHWVCWVALCFCMGFSIPTTGYDWVWLGIFPLVLPSNTQSYPVNTQWKRYYWVWLYPAWLLALWRFLWGHTQHTQYFYALCVIGGSAWMVVNLAERFQMVVAGTKNPALGGVVWVSRRPSLPAG